MSFTSKKKKEKTDEDCIPLTSVKMDSNDHQAEDQAPPDNFGGSYSHESASSNIDSQEGQAELRYRGQKTYEKFGVDENWCDLENGAPNNGEYSFMSDVIDSYETNTKKPKSSITFKGDLYFNMCITTFSKNKGYITPQDHPYNEIILDPSAFDFDDKSIPKSQKYTLSGGSPIVVSDARVMDAVVSHVWDALIEHKLISPPITTRKDDTDH